jgi:hypothetical protein
VTDPVPPPEQPTTGWWSPFYDNYDLGTYLIADKDDVDAILADALTEEQAEAICDAHNGAVTAALAEARAAERRAVEPLARWIVSHHAGSVDHACRECVPSGGMVIEGFRCAFHQSRAILDAVATDTPEEPER